ncbi:unnamed protein product [Paramecium sonneborni]|uniref:Uncharacterized protein n=1 Tax=Paramecium sonneborni TaxID=65129 RepID=A0A8S1RDH5_9CILI|nr:unnamed protein product [Paramecium sonneborni]
MLKGVKVRKVYEDEIDEPAREKKVKILESQFHKQKIREKGQQFDDIDEDEEKSDRQKTKEERNKENQKKGEMLFQQRQLQKAISECEFCLSNEKLKQQCYACLAKIKILQFLHTLINSADGTCFKYQRCRR